MPGYSGTPLAKKLGIREGSNVALVGVPPEVMAEVQAALSSCRIANNGRGPFDFIFLFANSQAEFRPLLRKMTNALASAGMLWVSWPKKASGVPTDLTEDVIRQIGLKAGLVDVKVCAVTDVWSGLKFVIPLKRRPKAEAGPVKNRGA
jgi:hypothetical protein